MGAPAKPQPGRLLRAAFKPAAVLLPLLAVALDGLQPTQLTDLLALALVLAALLSNALRRKGLSDPWTAALALSLAAALASATGGTGGPLGSLPLVLVAAAVALASGRPWAPVGVALAGELALFAGGGGVAWGALAGRAALTLVAAGMHHALTRAELLRVREESARAQREDRLRKRDAALSLRIAPTESARASGHGAPRERASLEEVHASLVGLLTLVRRSMGLRTCALFWVSPRGTLRLVEAATDDDLITEDLPASGGALGAVIRLGQPVLRAGLRDDCAAVGYYPGPCPVRALAAVPVRDGDEVRGVFVGDRDDDRAFTDGDRAVLDAAALQARRLIDNERVFSRLERARSELATLFTAARTFGEATTEAQVLDAVAESAQAAAGADLVVVTAWEQGVHRVQRVLGDAPMSLQGSVFDDNLGIASAVVKERHALPFRGQFDPATQYVFTREHPLDGMRSALCVPLVARDHVLGTLTLAARRPRAFAGGTAQLLGVLAGGAAVALANAAAVRRLEALATTDPMTGHLNKRALEAEFEKRMRAAARFKRPLALVVLDIDRFKSVNDTYGHAVGDVVIKGLGAVLSRCRRETDAVARFGGEEFVVVCEETDAQGALLLAERIREELMRQVFATERGELRVTCSLGVAAFPRDAQDFAGLFAKADGALYVAKQSGRNQSRAATGSSVRAA